MFDLTILIFVLLGSIIIGGLAVLTVRGFWQRIMLIGILSGFLLYSGIGIAHLEVPNDYLIYYFGFLIAFSFAFLFFRVAFVGISIQSGRGLTRVFANVHNSPWWASIIWVYLLLHLVLLIYPEFRLHYLLAPPPLDLTTVWIAMFEPQEQNFLLKLIWYADILLTPFFYIALFRYRQHIWRAGLILALLLYIQYVAGGYISRSEIGMALAIILLVQWVNQPRSRPKLMLGVAVMTPLLLVAFYVHTVVRIGGIVEDLNPAHAIITVLESEIMFPRNVGIPIIEGGERVCLIDYAKWIIALPIPKVLTGEIGARINFEISEIVLGVGPGEIGWYVVLPGLMVESVYIYGNYFFWLHGVFIALLAAFVIRLLERTPQLLFFKAYVIVLFAFVLNRAGIGGLLPVVVNEFLLFYLYVFVVVFGLFRKQKRSATLYSQLRNVNSK